MLTHDLQGYVIPQFSEEDIKKMWSDENYAGAGIKKDEPAPTTSDDTRPTEPEGDHLVGEDYTNALNALFGGQSPVEKIQLIIESLDTDKPEIEVSDAGLNEGVKLGLTAAKGLLENPKWAETSKVVHPSIREKQKEQYVASGKGSLK